MINPLLQEMLRKNSRGETLIQTLVNVARREREVLFEGKFPFFVKLDGSRVTVIDQMIESMILNQQQLADIFVGEETGTTTRNYHNPGVLYVDPIDGTNNLIAGRLNNVWISIAYSINDGIIPDYGIVIAPWRKEMVITSREGFAIIEGFDVDPDNIEIIPWKDVVTNRSVFAVGNASGRFRKDTEKMQTLLDYNCEHSGSIVNDLVKYVKGEVSGVFNNHAKIWDIAAFLPMLYGDIGQVMTVEDGIWTVSINTPNLIVD